MVRVGSVFEVVVGNDVAWRIEKMDREWWNILGTHPTPFPVFEYRAYKAPTKDWDHDHCQGCDAKFMNDGAHGTLAAGWAVLDADAERLGVEKSAEPDPSRFKTLPDGSLLVRQPDGAFIWLCDDCHRIVEGLRTGQLKIQMENK